MRRLRRRLHRCRDLEHNTYTGAMTFLRWVVWLQQRLSPVRFTHSLAVADTAALLAVAVGADPPRARLAGLLHDLARELPDAESERLFHVLQLEEKPIVMTTALLHGPVAAAWLERTRVISDAEVLEAVRRHTTGAPGMGRLAEVVFLADAIEPGRDYPGADLLRSEAMKDFDTALLHSVEHSLAYLSAADMRIDSRSVMYRDELRRRWERRGR